MSYLGQRDSGGSIAGNSGPAAIIRSSSIAMHTSTQPAQMLILSPGEMSHGPNGMQQYEQSLVRATSWMSSMKPLSRRTIERTNLTGI